MKEPVTINRDSFDLKNETERLQELAEFVTERAKKLGATAAEVGIAEETGFSVNVRLDEVDTIEYQDDKSLGVTVYFDQKKGSASTSDISKASIERSIEAACDIARYTSEDPCNGLAERKLMAFDYTDLDLYHPWSISPEQAVEIAKNCEAKGIQYSNKINNSEGVSVSTSAGLHIYANSHGFSGVVPGTRHDISCTLLAEHQGMKQRDYDYTCSRDPLCLQSIERIAETAAQKTINRLGAAPISTRNTPVIFSAENARGLIGCLIAAVSGGNLYRKASFLLDSLGELVLPSWLNLSEKPHQKGALGSAPFDSEGVRTRECDLVANGVLQHYVLGSYSARKLGTKTTANAGGVNNLIVSNSGISFDELLKQMDTGFLVTELIGHGVNIVTGDYSRGAAGFWVEKGKIVSPVEEVTIAGNLKDLLLGIEAIANDVDIRGNVQCGSVLIRSMQLAGS